MQHWTGLVYEQPRPRKCPYVNSQYGLVDPWHFSHPSVRQCSFFLPCTSFILAHRLYLDW